MHYLKCVPETASDHNALVCIIIYRHLKAQEQRKEAAQANFNIHLPILFAQLLFEQEKVLENANEQHTCFVKCFP